MLVRLRNRKNERIFLLMCVVSVMTLSIHTDTGLTTNNALFQSDADFFLRITAPENMEYWQTLNITITVEEQTGSTQNNISAKIALESGLYLIDGENDTQNLGDFDPLEEKQINFTITASTEFLTNPIIVYKIYLLKGGIEQYVNTVIEGDVYLLGYGIGSITIQYPILKVTSVPLELEGFVVPRLSLLHDEKQTLTYNISNEGIAAMKNLTFQVEYDNDVIEIISTTLRGEIDGNSIENTSSSSSSFPSLDTFPGSSFVLFEIKIRSISFIATDHSRVYLYVSTDFTGMREYSVLIQTYDIYNIYKYDNALVFIVWPIYILFFVILGFLITVYSMKKQKRRTKKAKELVEKYGASYVD